MKQFVVNNVKDFVGGSKNNQVLEDEKMPCGR